MTFLPIVERELRVRSRLRSTNKVRSLAAALACIVVLGVVTFGGGATGRGGGIFFKVIAWLGFIYCLLEGARATADALSRERREGTLGLLFLTDLKGYDVVLGKLCATSLASVYGLLAVFPPISLVLLVGGVTGGEFWRLVLVLMNTLFFSLTAGLLVSSTNTTESRSVMRTLYVVLTLAAVPPLLQATLPKLISPVTWCLAICPTQGFVALFDTEYRTQSDQYWISIISTHVLGWLQLAGASYFAPRLWEDLPRRRTRPLWLRLALLIGLTNEEKTRQRRCVILSRNPILWWFSRHEVAHPWIWLLVLGFCSGGSALLLIQQWQPTAGLLVLGGALLVHLSLAVWTAAKACYAFPALRESGLLDVLLTTPLEVREILEGPVLGLIRALRWPLTVLLTIEFFLLASLLGRMAWGGYSPDATFLGLGIFVTVAGSLSDIYMAGHYGLWLGLNSRKPSIALGKILALLLLPLVFIPCCQFFYPLIGIFRNAIYINMARSNLHRLLRTQIAERFTNAVPPPMLLTRRRASSQLPSVLPPE